MSFRVAQVAIEDADLSAAWYDSRRLKLGKEFIDELGQTFQRIQDHLIMLRTAEKWRERAIFPTPDRPRE